MGLLDSVAGVLGMKGGTKMQSTNPADYGYDKEQLEKAVMEREKLMSLIYKCQGALELLDSMEKKND